MNLDNFDVMKGILYYVPNGVRISQSMIYKAVYNLLNDEEFKQHFDYKFDSSQFSASLDTDLSNMELSELIATEFENYDRKLVPVIQIKKKLRCSFEKNTIPTLDKNELLIIKSMSDKFVGHLIGAK